MHAAAVQYQGRVTYGVIAKKSYLNLITPLGLTSILRKYKSQGNTLNEQMRKQTGKFRIQNMGYLRKQLA